MPEVRGRLHYDIRSRLTPCDLENFSRLMEAAVRAEKFTKERKTYSASYKESGSRFEKRKDPPTTIFHAGKESRIDGSKRGGTESSSKSS